MCRATKKKGHGLSLAASDAVERIVITRRHRHVYADGVLDLARAAATTLGRVWSWGLASIDTATLVAHRARRFRICFSRKDRRLPLTDRAAFSDRTAASTFVAW